MALEKPVPVGLDEGETYRKAILYLAGFMTSIKYDKDNGGNRFLQCNLYRSVKKRIEDLNLFSLRFFFFLVLSFRFSKENFLIWL